MEESSLYNTSDSAGLAANRQGTMTQAQRVSIGIMLAVDGGLALGVGLVGLIVGHIVWVWRPVLPWQISVVIVVLAALLLLGIVVWRLARLLSGWLDLSAGQVEQAKGRIVWMGKSYGAQIQGRRLRFIFGRRIPPPDDYGFFYLPRSGWILSIDRLASTGTQTDLYLLNALARANGFSVESLKANRAGRLTKDQAWQLLVPMWGSVLAGLLMIGITIAFSGYVLLHDLKSMALMIPIFFALAVMMGFYSWNEVTTIIPDVSEGCVIAMEGPVYKIKGSTSGQNVPRMTYYYYEINNRRFEVSPQAYKALFAGRPYRLYYTPYSKSIVSIEPLASADV
jgi:hypothetical protein